MQLVQATEPHDKPKRTDFATDMLRRIEDDERLYEKYVGRCLFQERVAGIGRVERPSRAPLFDFAKYAILLTRRPSVEGSKTAHYFFQFEFLNRFVPNWNLY
jgi:hypothetical protein